MTLPVNQLAVLVTTHCNLRCPDCCFGIPKRERMPARHEPWSAFERLAAHPRYLHRLCVTGGEPTLHPEFPRIAREFRDMFDADVMVLTTNGARVLDYKPEVALFDEIRITDFADPRSQEAIAWVRAELPDRLLVAKSEHVPEARRPGPGICDFRVFAAYAQGRLYPCCEGPGIADSPWVEPGPDWPERLAALRLPCDRCRFGQPVAAP